MCWKNKRIQTYIEILKIQPRRTETIWDCSTFAFCWVYSYSIRTARHCNASCQLKKCPPCWLSRDGCCYGDVAWTVRRQCCVSYFVEINDWKIEKRICLKVSSFWNIKYEMLPENISTFCISLKGEIFYRESTLQIILNRMSCSA